jgi:DNA-binding IclR family transcriptional regulator
MFMATTPETTPSSNYQVRALERALDILDAFDVATPELTVTRLAERTGLPKSTVIRLVSILVERRYLERAPGSESVRIGVRAFEVGSIYIQSTSLEIEARPIMARLAEQTGQTANLGILDGQDVVHIAVAAPDRPLRYWATIGKREGAYYTGLGKVMMAAMPDDELDHILNGSGFIPQTEKTLVEPDELRAEIEQIRQRGYGFDDEESNLGIFCIAAPIVDHEGKVIAALSISGSKAEFTVEETPTYVEAVRQACQDISARFGGKHPPALIRS